MGRLLLKFKLKFINKLIIESNNYLTHKYKPFEEFEIFEEDDIPQNSDIVFILAQYLQCFEKLRADNVVLRKGRWCWKLKAEEGDITDDGFVYLETVKPKRLKD